MPALRLEIARRAAERARWLAELAAAHDAASAAARAIVEEGLHGADAIELEVQIEQLRVYVDRVQRGAFNAKETPP